MCDAIWSGTQIKVRQVIERPFSSALYRSSGWNAASCLVFAPDTIMWLIHHPGMNPDASSFLSITWSVFRGAILHKSVQVQTHQTRRMTVPVKMTTSRLANKFSGTMQKPGATSLWHDSTAVRQDCVTPAILSRSLANLNLLSSQQFIDSQCWAILHSTVPKHELLFSSYSTLYFKEWLKTMGQCVRLLAAIYIKRVMLFEVTFLLHFTFQNKSLSASVVEMNVSMLFSCEASEKFRGLRDFTRLNFFGGWIYLGELFPLSSQLLRAPSYSDRYSKVTIFSAYVIYKL